jgi:hypothetical protein
MCTPFLTLTVSTPRDVVRVRQLARQAATLLSFNAIDQTCLAAAAFDLAWQAWQPTGRATVCFILHEEKLRITFLAAVRTERLRWEAQEPASAGHALLLEKPLPVSQRGRLPTELTYTLEQIVALSPGSLFEELQTANRELLRCLLELAPRRAQADEIPLRKKETDAA